MERNDIDELVRDGTLYNQKFEENFQETHISWVLFTADFAVKIKKPIKLTFLDFSTLQLRKHFCEQEVKLNSRFSEIYIGVEALSLNGEKWDVVNGNLNIKDYGVVMKRQDNSHRMDRLLSKNQVSKKAICDLARLVAEFHKGAVVVSTPYQLNEAKELFGDLRSILGIFEMLPDRSWTNLIKESTKFSDDFLTIHQNLFTSRALAGNVRDVHGDLHSRNIFLNPEPVIFDCIEFNDSFRQIDVWYEVAFLCMDMEFFGHRELSEDFFKEYTQQKGELVNAEKRQIFIYFKMLRANIRAKVLALKVGERASDNRNIEDLSDSMHYLRLMRSYMNELRSI